MAARVHVDNAINERRVRPIYDHLDNGNNKKALQEADKILKKQKDLACAKALKALALTRLKKSEEAEEILSAIHATHPTDDATLQAMHICYREMDKLDLLVDLMEEAVKKEPSEDLLSQLFVCYIRVGDYSKQRQSALQLHRMKQNNPYYFSAVMSIYMEAMSEKDPKKKSTLLLLAERMVDKCIKDDRVEADAEVLMWIMILEAQGKNQEAIDVLNGDLGKMFSSVLNFKETKKAELLIAQNKKSEALSIYKELLKNQPDNWQYFESYYSLVKELKNDPAGSNLWKECVEFIDMLQQENLEEKSVKRGPFLAKIIISNGTLNEGGDADVRSKVLDLLCSYYEKFGHKQVAYFDLTHIFSRLTISKGTITEFLDRIQASLYGGDAKKLDEYLPTDTESVHKHQCFLKLRYFLDNWQLSSTADDKSSISSSQISDDSRKAFVSYLRNCYSHSVGFEKELLATDQNPADGYLQLATHVASELAQSTGEEAILIDIINWLEQALIKSPSAFHLKLLLIKIYSMLGLGLLAKYVAEKLDIKYIMHDTLGYLVNGTLMRCGHYYRAVIFLNAALKFYSSVKKETSDALVSSYKYGTFNKIPEAIAFREKLLNSFQFAINTADHMFLLLQTEYSNGLDHYQKWFDEFRIDPENDETVWEDLVDNRDLEIIQPSRRKYLPIVKDAQKSSFANEINYLRIRNLSLRALAAAHRVISSPLSASSADVKERVDVFVRLATRLEEQISNCCDINACSCCRSSSWFPIEAPAPSRLLIFNRLKFGDSFTNVFRLLTRFLSAYRDQTLESLRITDDALPNTMLELSESLNSMETKSLMGKRDHVEALVNFCELTTICSILMAVTHKVLESLNKGKKGKKRSKDSTPILEDFDKICLSIVDSIGRVVQKVKTEQAIDGLIAGMIKQKISSLSDGGEEAPSDGAKAQQPKLENGIGSSSNEKGEGGVKTCPAVKIDSVFAAAAAGESDEILSKRISAEMDSSYTESYTLLTSLLDDSKTFIKSLTL